MQLSIRVTLFEILTPEFSSTRTTVLLLVIASLLFLTAIVSGAKVAFFSLKAKDINQIKTKDQISGKQLVRLLSQPRLLFASIITANTFLNIAIIVTSHQLALMLMPKGLPQVWFLILEGLVITLMIVLFGIVFPRVYATQNRMRMALFAAPILVLISKFLKPITSFIISANAFLEDKEEETQSVINAPAFEQTIQQSIGHTASEGEVNIFRGILRFGHVRAKEVMQPRMEIIGIPNNASLAMVRELITKHGLSRMPVYDGDLDHITGILHFKDIAPILEAENLVWQEHIRPALFVPELKPISELLSQFQMKGIHAAIVVDEYGGTSGILTVEDIVEEVTGEITDEFDTQQQYHKKQEDGSFVLDGRITIADLCRVAGLPLDTFDKVRGESDTLGGMLLERVGKFPGINEQISLLGFTFLVLDTNTTRISTIKMVAPSTPLKV